MSQRMNITGALLAGGKSRRMGFNKAFIEVDGKPIIERNLRVLESIFDEVFVVANDMAVYEGLGVRVVSDIFRGAGALGGIHTALFYSSREYTFVTACDMPYLNGDVIRAMCDLRDGFHIYIPFIEDRYHPLHALYSRRCLKRIESMIEEGNLRVTDLTTALSVKRLDEGYFKGLPVISSIDNVNTKDDLSRLGLC